MMARHPIFLACTQGLHFEILKALESLLTVRQCLASQEEGVQRKLVHDHPLY